MNKQKKRKRLMGGDERASATPTGLPSEIINPYAACVVSFDHENESHLYLNAAIPTGHDPINGICPKCKHAYSHVIHQGGGTCRECRLEAAAVAAKRLEQAGINLGWGASEHTPEYERARRQYSPARVHRL